MILLAPHQARRLLHAAPLVRRRLSAASSPPLPADEFDVVVVGGGPGGYVAAIKAGQLGLKVACIEKRGSLGGTCLNVGCIPSKALLNNSHLLHMAQHDFANRGIIAKDVSFDLSKMMAAKEKTVSSLTSGIEMLFKKNNVTYARGSGRIVGPNEVRVEGPASAASNGSRTFRARKIVIATGSEATTLPNFPVDEKRIVTSTGALALTRVPDSLVVVGGGVIGLELGSVWSRLGAKVTVVDAAKSIGGVGIDATIAAAFQKLLVAQGLRFELGAALKSIENDADALRVTVDVNGAAKVLGRANVVLMAVGRRPYTRDLGLESVGIELDERGRVPVNPKTLETRVPGIYAIGDVIAGPMLAHKAEEEGIAVIENMVKPGSGHVNYSAIPSVIYTHPEVAWVGMTEEAARAQARERSGNISIGTFPFLANSRAKANMDTAGLVKIIADAETDRILGAHVIGPNAGEMIAEATLAMEYGASSEDIARTCHAHPTLSEAFKEACMATHGAKKAIHF